MLVRSSAVSWESGLPKKSNAAERIVHATASLLASRGYFGTGLSDIIARAEAPKGSLYHYFPEGKPQTAPGTPASSVRCAPTGWRKSSPPRAPG